MTEKRNTHSKKVRPPTPVPPEDEGQDCSIDSFPIIGIGASAGGLQALEVFLDNMPSP
jgi:chemotaxis response regulator CheB